MELSIAEWLNYWCALYKIRWSTDCVTFKQVLIKWRCLILDMIFAIVYTNSPNVLSFYRCSNYDMISIFQKDIMRYWNNGKAIFQVLWKNKDHYFHRVLVAPVDSMNLAELLRKEQRTIRKSTVLIMLIMDKDQNRI